MFNVFYRELGSHSRPVLRANNTIQVRRRAGNAIIHIITYSSYVMYVIPMALLMLGMWR